MKDKEERKIAVFILTHGRADNVVTYKTLRDCGYTGKIYLLIDDEDDQEARYRELYGDQVVQFCKEDYFKYSMVMIPNQNRKVVVCARNAVFDVARDLGITHFVMLDDDYNSFLWRFRDGDKLGSLWCKNLDGIMDVFFNFLEVSNAKTVAFGQGGDWIGGVQGGTMKTPLKRKSMNSFFCRTDRPIHFVGAINEDVNAYITEGNRGELHFSVMRVMLTQGQTQAHAGGLTDIYLDKGTYVKSFLTVMINPSCVKVQKMGVSEQRMHHNIKWRYAVPKILSDKYKKADE